KQGIDDLIAMVTEELANLRTVVKLRIPQSEYKLVSDLMREGKVLDSDYEENDVLLTVEIPQIWEHKVQAYLV
ncbi:MAG: GTPase HflX, partial [Verrucomicrobia bacterium]|nr:GTPase HflX [Verrucomicrobiota bacterium]